MRNHFIVKVGLAAASLSCMISTTCLPVYGLDDNESTSIPIPGAQVYTFTTDDEFDYYRVQPDLKQNMPAKSTLSIEGNLSADTNKKDGLPTYKFDGDMNNLFDPGLDDENADEDTNEYVGLSIDIDTSSMNINGSKDQWTLYEDYTNEIDFNDKKGNLLDSFPIGDNFFLSGGIAVETSYDGEYWVKDSLYTDVLGDGDEFSYHFNANQLTNGCYVKLTFVYCMKKKVGKKLLVADKNSYQKHAEVYEFYVYSPDAQKEASSINAKPKKEINPELEQIDAEKGFSDEADAFVMDSHSDVGGFIINGFSGRVHNDKDGTPVFLKNVGDKVTLWFGMNTDGYEEMNSYSNVYMSYPGILTIEFENFEGEKVSNTYMPFLEAAYSSTKADTKVRLFEEGNYKVTLDFDVCDVPKIGPFSGKKKYATYRKTFKFKVRNSDCMVYPFNLATGSELSGNTYTEEGFRLDLAKSRYLDISIQRSVLNGNNLDVRQNQVSTDLDEYTDEGVYKFTVSNEYTDEKVTKLIYVGTDNMLRAYVTHYPQYEVYELAEMKQDGAKFGDDGAIYYKGKKN